MALLGMELHAADVAAADRGSKLLSVGAKGQGIRRRFAGPPVRVHEIEATVLGHVPRQWVIRDHPADPVPSHMGNSQTRVRTKAPGMRPYQSEARQVSFLAPEGQHLHADTN